MSKEKVKVIHAFDEWNKAKAAKPTVKISFNEYRELLSLVGKAALILEKSKPEILMIEDNDLLIPIEEDEIPLVNDVEVFDRILESDQAFEALEESLGLNKSN